MVRLEGASVHEGLRQAIVSGLDLVYALESLWHEMVSDGTFLTPFVEQSHASMQ